MTVMVAVDDVVCDLITRVRNRALPELIGHEVMPLLSFGTELVKKYGASVVVVDALVETMLTELPDYGASLAVGVASRASTNKREHILRALLERRATIATSILFEYALQSVPRLLTLQEVLTIRDIGTKIGFGSCPEIRDYVFTHYPEMLEREFPGGF